MPRWSPNTPQGWLITLVYLVVAIGAATTQTVAGWVVFALTTAGYVGAVVATGVERGRR